MPTPKIKLFDVDEENRKLNEKLDLSTSEIGLSPSTAKLLHAEGVSSVRDLLCRTQTELLGISGFGEKSLEEVFHALKEIGFCRPKKGCGERADKSTDVTNVGYDVFIDPGSAPPLLLAQLFSELSNLHVKLGGSTLRIEEEETREFDLSRELVR